MNKRYMTEVESGDNPVVDGKPSDHPPLLRNYERSVVRSIWGPYLSGAPHLVQRLV